MIDQFGPVPVGVRLMKAKISAAKKNAAVMP
jgi:hypothetical protein